MLYRFDNKSSSHLFYMLCDCGGEHISLHVLIALSFLKFCHNHSLAPLHVKLVLKVRPVFQNSSTQVLCGCIMKYYLCAHVCDKGMREGVMERESIITSSSNINQTVLQQHNFLSAILLHCMEKTWENQSGLKNWSLDITCKDPQAFHLLDVTDEDILSTM